MNVRSAFVMFLGCAMTACTDRPEERDNLLVIQAPATMRQTAEAVADTLFLFYGAPVDSISYDEDGRRLRLVLHPGVYVQPTTLNQDGCSGGTVPLPAVLRLGAAASRVFVPAEPVHVVEVVHSEDPIEERTLLGAIRSCGRGQGTAYYRPSAGLPF